MLFEIFISLKINYWHESTIKLRHQAFHLVYKTNEDKDEDFHQNNSSISCKKELEKFENSNFSHIVPRSELDRQEKNTKTLK